MRAVILGALTVLALAACKPQANAPDALEPVGEARVAFDRANCEAAGGAWRTGERVAFCQYQTRDGGKSCTNGTQCEGACLARAQSCAPIRPLIGCNEVITGAGLRVTECVE